MSAETAAEVVGFEPDGVVLLPLYPQFSTTTTGSSLKDWEQAAKREGLSVPHRAVCCYPTEHGLIGAQIELIKAGLEQARPAGQPRILFSAHGLPKKVIARGDPYQRQVEMTLGAVVERLEADLGPVDHAICYQSRVGPLEWIGPATEEELARAAEDRVPVVVVPIAFVSEHSETLVELDVEYREKAGDLGVPAYVRVPTVGVAPEFIEGLAALAMDALSREVSPSPAGGTRLCPQACSQCVCGVVS
jgi:ferrochelatase